LYPPENIGTGINDSGHPQGHPYDDFKRGICEVVDSRFVALLFWSHRGNTDNENPTRSAAIDVSNSV